jgi:hypothetical protein
MDYPPAPKYSLCFTIELFVVLFLFSCTPAPGSPTLEALSPCKVKDANGNDQNIYSLNLNSNDRSEWFYEQFTINEKSNVEISRGVHYQAFQYLVDQVRQWSFARNIPLDGDKVLRITVTFIRPDLVKAAFLNTILSNNRHDLYQNYNLDRYRERVKNKVIQLLEKEKYFFLVTVTSDSPIGVVKIEDDRIVKIPVESMILVDSNNLAVVPNHDDHFLAKEIRLSDGPLGGFIGYPMAAEFEDECNLLLNHLSTSITISVPSISIDGRSYSEQTWRLTYNPLIADELLPGVPQLSFPHSFSLNSITPIDKPPLPAWSENDEDAYWKSMAQYVWYKLFPGLFSETSSSAINSSNQAEVEVSP